jgi:hypothetical protein
VRVLSNNYARGESPFQFFRMAHSTGKSTVMRRLRAL